MEEAGRQSGCNGPTNYLGTSMSIEGSKKTATKEGGIKMVLCPNGLYSPLTSGVSCCISTTCSRQAFDHIEALARMPPSIKYCIPIDPDGGVSGQTLLHRDVLRPGVMDMHLGEGPSNVADAKLTKMGARLVSEAVNASLDLGQVRPRPHPHVASPSPTRRLALTHTSPRPRPHPHTALPLPTRLPALTHTLTHAHTLTLTLTGVDQRPQAPCR